MIPLSRRNDLTARKIPFIHMKSLVDAGVQDFSQQELEGNSIKFR